MKMRTLLVNASFLSFCLNLSKVLLCGYLLQSPLRRLDCSSDSIEFLLSDLELDTRHCGDNGVHSALYKIVTHNSHAFYKTMDHFRVFRW